MGKTVLVVDDSATVRALIEMNLRKIPDLKLVFGVDGVDGLEKFKKESPAALLTDINMPNMSGLELIRAVRDTVGDKTTPIVVISTRGEDSDTEAGMKAGATVYVTKPINGAQLVETVRKLLG